MIVMGLSVLALVIFVEYYTFRQDNGRIPSSDSDELKRTDKCRCGNCALILDLDGIVHVL